MNMKFAETASNIIWENLIKASLSLGSTSFGMVHNSSNVKWVYTGRVFCNRIFSVNIVDRNLDEYIKDASEMFKTQKMPFMWINNPSIPSEKISGQLLANQISFVRSWSGMELNQSDFTKAKACPDVQIIEVKAMDQMKVWNVVRSDGFGSPRKYLNDSLDIFSSLKEDVYSSWIHYLALKDGTAASTCSMYLDGYTAGLYWVATLPEFRGHGIASMLVDHAVMHAFSMGYSSIILQASEMGKGVYEKLGFKEYNRIDLYSWNP